MSYLDMGDGLVSAKVPNVDLGKCESTSYAELYKKLYGTDGCPVVPIQHPAAVWVDRAVALAVWGTAAVVLLAVNLLVLAAAVWVAAFVWKSVMGA